MDEIKHSKDKIYYTMGEVTEMFGVRPSLIRYWEQEFDILKPHRNKKGNRLFTPQDVDNLRLIYHLVKEKNMKIEAARRHLKGNKDQAGRDAEVVERLLSIRAMLEQIKQDLLYGAPEDGDDYDVEADKDNAVYTPETDVESFEEPRYESRQEEEPLLSNIVLSPETGEFIINGEVVEVSAIIDEEKNYAGKMPFEEQRLFEVAERDADPDKLIDEFVENNHNGDDEEEDDGVPNPFEGLDESLTASSAAASSAAAAEHGEAGEPEKKNYTVVEQTLF